MGLRFSIQHKSGLVCFRIKWSVLFTPRSNNVQTLSSKKYPSYMQCMQAHARSLTRFVNAIQATNINYNMPMSLCVCVRAWFDHNTTISPIHIIRFTNFEEIKDKRKQTYGLDRVYHRSQRKRTQSSEMKNRDKLREFHETQCFFRKGAARIHWNHSMNEKDTHTHTNHEI